MGTFAQLECHEDRAKRLARALPADCQRRYWHGGRESKIGKVRLMDYGSCLEMTQRPKFTVMRSWCPQSVLRVKIS